MRASFSGRNTHDVQHHQTGGVLKSLIVFFLAIGLLAGIAICAGGYFAYNEAKRPGPLEKETIVLLKSGMSVASIAEELSSAGAIRHT